MVPKGAQAWKRWLMVGALWLAVASRGAGMRLYFEAEEMAADKAWIVKPHFENFYYGGPINGKMLWGSENGSQGEARRILDIDRAGPATLWVRYLDSPYRGPFKVQVLQHGAVVAEKIFDAVSLRATEAGQTKWGYGYAVFVWDGLPVTLEAGTAEMLVTKAEPMVTAWINRFIDCMVLSDDPAYQPDAADFVKPLYVKVRMGPKQPAPCVIHIFGHRPYPPWGIMHSNIYRNKLGTPESYPYPAYQSGGANPNYLAANTESAWVNIAPLLGLCGDNHVDFFATQAYYPCMPVADYTLIFSETPSEAGQLKSFTRSGSGGGMSVIINLYDRPNIKSDLEFSSESAAAAKQLPPAAGKRPRRFPVMTECGVTSDFYQPATVKNELANMAALGFSNITRYDPLYYADGCSTYTTGVPTFHLAKGGCLSNPDVPAIQARVREDAAREIERGHLKEILYWNQMDEPASVTLEHMTTCPFCADKFRRYLQEKGLHPTDFGKQTWDEIVPTSDGEKAPELYYYSVRCRAQIITDFFKIGTDALHKLIPAAPAMANLWEDLTWHGNALKAGVDWFQLQSSGALNYGWTENGLAYVTSYQLCGYRMDFLRASCATAGHPFGAYAQFKSPWDTQVNVHTLIGHGARAVFYYNYGPFYTSSTDQLSLHYNLYPAMRATNYAIGAVEEYLIEARVPKSRIGLLYSDTTDIWTLKDDISLFGKERMGLYLLLRHLGYPVDFVTEEDVAAGKIAGYQAIFAVGSHLKQAALAPLAGWVRGGGLLYVSAGSLQRDEFDRPLAADTALGITRGPFIFKENPGAEKANQYTLASLDAVTTGGKKLEVLSGMQKGEGKTGVLAAFSDGSPAVQLFPLDKGRVAFCGFFPGLAYNKSGILRQQAFETELKKAGKEPATYNPPDYGDEYRTLLGTMMKTVAWRPAVVTDNYLVEANLLESSRGLLIVLSNWTGIPLPAVRVTLRSTAAFARPIAAGISVRTKRLSNGSLDMTLPLGPGAFIALPFRK